MFVIFEQVLILLVFVSAGYALKRANIIKEGQSQAISQVLVYIIAPLNVMKTFSQNFNISYFKENWIFLLGSVAMLAVLCVFSTLASRLFSKEAYERYIVTYTLLVPNFGYAGYALAEALLGPVGLMNFMMFALPANLYIYVYALARLTKRSFTPKKLLNPNIIATVVGIVIGLASITLPNFLSSILSKGSACLAPISMILAGVVIAEYKLKDILKIKKVYILSALRLVVIPLLVGGVFALIGNKALTPIAVLFCALPCGMNTIVFPKSVNENCKLGAGLALVSTLLSCITIPLVCTLFGVR